MRLSTEVDEEKEQLGQLAEKRQEVMFLVEGGQKELTALQASHRQQQVTINLLRLRVDQRQTSLAKTDSHVFNLERERVELENVSRQDGHVLN